MTVRSTPLGKPSKSGLARTTKAPMPASPGAGSRVPQTPGPASPTAASDPLRLPNEARSLQQMRTAATGTTSELSADRMREVVRRMNDGHYDEPEVMDEVIRRIAKEL